MIRNKPTSCYQCPLLPSSLGFKPDSLPPAPKIFVLRENPSTAEVTGDEVKLEVQREMWERDYFGAAGISWDDVAVSYVFRCKPKSEPTGKIRKQAEEACRVHDGQHCGKAGRLAAGGVATWGPNMCIVTFEPFSCIDIPSRKLFIRRAFQVAADFAARDYKPLIIMGEAALRIVYPSLLSARTRDRETGFKNWVGHYFFMNGWPHNVAAPKIDTATEANLVLISEAAKKQFCPAGNGGTTKWSLKPI